MIAKAYRARSALIRARSGSVPPSCQATSRIRTLSLGARVPIELAIGALVPSGLAPGALVPIGGSTAWRRGGDHMPWAVNLSG
jgi:hypothetical protein